MEHQNLKIGPKITINMRTQILGALDAIAYLTWCTSSHYSGDLDARTSYMEQIDDKAQFNGLRRSSRFKLGNVKL